MPRFDHLLSDADIEQLTTVRKDTVENPLELSPKRFDAYLVKKIASIVRERVAAGDSKADALKEASTQGHMLQHSYELKQALRVKAAKQHERMLKRHRGYKDYDS